MRSGVVVRQKKLGSVTDKVSVVLLARLSSSRLPGKALRIIEGRETLGHILQRLDTLMDRSQIILATSNESGDDALEDFADREGIACFRGSLERVGERFYEAARIIGSDFACRINGDNIFLAPEILKSMMLQVETGDYNFLSNVQGRTFPKGMSVEIVRVSYYGKRLDRIKQDPYCNEHVMVCLYEEPAPPDHFYLRNESLPEAAAIQLALDTPEDWERSQWMLKEMPAGRYDLATTFEYYKRYEESLKG